MPNSIDFRADQIQTKQIIVTGSGAGTTKLLIYGIEAQGSPVNEGLINQTVFPSDTTIGSDVFLYVSGALNTKGSATVRGTSVFGGDLVVSGSLYNGLVTAAGGLYSHAEGESTTAEGAYSHAEGNSTTASNNYSHAEGQGSEASGQYSHAEGQGTVASGNGSHAEGFSSEASGQYSHAEGDTTNASGQYSHAEGVGTIASDNGSHAEGFSSEASGQYSHAEGNTTKAIGFSSHAEGYQTIASGSYSHAEGYQTIAFGTGSHASGYGTIASGSVDGTALSYTSIVQAATGRFNARGNTTSLFVVGNGTGDSDALRADIFRAESTGILVLSGGISHKVKSIYYTPISPPLPANDTYNLTLNDYLVIVNVTAGGPFKVNLPASATTPIGTTYVIRRYDGGAYPHDKYVNVYSQNGDFIINSSGNRYNSATPLIISGNASILRGGSITLTYIGNYYDSVLGTHPTWMTTSELDI